MTIKFEKNFLIKMNTKTVRELRSIAMYKGLRGYYKLKKADLVASLLDNQTKKCQHHRQGSVGRKEGVRSQ